MNTHQHDWPQEIADRINCRGIAGWLRLFAAALGKNFHDLVPIAPAARHEIDIPEWGLTLVLSHPHAGHVDAGDPDRWVLESARFHPPAAALPFGLDALNETPDSAKAKLSDDIVVGDSTAGDRRVSCFLDDARVVELSFAPGLKGLTGVQVVRLGAGMEYVDKENNPSRHCRPPPQASR